MYSIKDFEQMPKEEIKELLLKASDHYYNESNSIISDEQFDNGTKVFVKRFPTDDLPKMIGAKVKVTEWNKATHKIPMSSLNKVNTVEEFTKWTNNIGDSYYIIMDKLDGISIDLEYENGNLVKAITRGDGIEGENILNNVKKMKNVQTNIKRFTGSIRGEIIMFVTDFDRLNKVLRDSGEKELKNPRNSASGISKRYDGVHSKYLSILYYDVTGDWSSEEQKLNWCRENNIATCFWSKCNVEQCKTYYNEYENHLRVATPYDIDGLVIKANSIKLQNQLGLVNKNPKGQVAWKFTAMKVKTIILGIEWSHGQNMRITPVALLEPVKIGGVTVKRASLHNMEIFHKFDLGMGDQVLISRRNDVIPYVESVLKYVNAIKFKRPLSCPMCNEELIENEKFLMCENTQCKGLRIGNLNKWVNALDIDAISEKTVELFVRAETVYDPSDFYRLDTDKISNLEGMGQRKSKKIITNFNNKKDIPLEIFIDGLNMPNFSKSRAKTLIENGIDTLDKMLNIKEVQLVELKGIGSEVAKAIVYGLSGKKTVINKLLEVITIKAVEKPKEVEMSSSKLIGEVYVFTGAVQRIDGDGNRFTRNMLQQLVFENGGSCEKSVKKGVTGLIQADPSSTSSKTQKANKLGIKIISEASFFKSIGM